MKKPLIYISIIFLTTSIKLKNKDIQKLAIEQGRSLYNDISSDLNNTLSIDQILSNPIFDKYEKNYNEKLGKKSDFIFNGQNIKNVGEHQTIRINTPQRKQKRQEIAEDLSKIGSFAGFTNDGQEKYTGEVTKDFIATIVTGAPASGKSTSLVNPLSRQLKARIIDSDEVKKMLPEYDNGKGAGLVHKQSSDVILTDMIMPKFYKGGEYCGDNIIIPIVGKSPKSIFDYWVNLRKAGYSVHLIFNNVSENNFVKRAVGRFLKKGRFLSPGYLNSIGTLPLQAYEKMKKLKCFNSYTMYNGNLYPPVKVEEIEYEDDELMDKELLAVN